MSSVSDTLLVTSLASPAAPRLSLGRFGSSFKQVKALNEGYNSVQRRFRHFGSSRRRKAQGREGSPQWKGHVVKAYFTPAACKDRQGRLLSSDMLQCMPPLHICGLASVDGPLDG